MRLRGDIRRSILTLQSITGLLIHADTLCIYQSSSKQKITKRETGNCEIVS